VRASPCVEFWRVANRGGSLLAYTVTVGLQVA
jgi:hypothetical protein